MQGVAQVRQKVARYSSRTLDQVPMYPGDYVETWQLLSIEPVEAGR